MKLNDKQLKKFKELHKNNGLSEKYSEKEIREIANGKADFYLTLFEIHQKQQRSKHKKD